MESNTFDLMKTASLVSVGLHQGTFEVLSRENIRGWRQQIEVFCMSKFAFLQISHDILLMGVEGDKICEGCPIQFTLFTKILSELRLIST